MAMHASASRALLLVSAVAAAALAGCLGGDDTPTTSAPTQPEDEPEDDQTLGPIDKMPLPDLSEPPEIPDPTIPPPEPTGTGVLGLVDDTVDTTCDTVNGLTGGLLVVKIPVQLSACG